MFNNKLINEKLLNSAIKTCAKCRNKITGDISTFKISRNHYEPYCNENSCLIANALPYYHEGENDE